MGRLCRGMILCHHDQAFFELSCECNDYLIYFPIIYKYNFMLVFSVSRSNPNFCLDHMLDSRGILSLPISCPRRNANCIRKVSVEYRESIADCGRRTLLLERCGRRYLCEYNFWCGSEWPWFYQCCRSVSTCSIFQHCTLAILAKHALY